MSADHTESQERPRILTQNDVNGLGHSHIADRDSMTSSPYQNHLGLTLAAEVSPPERPQVHVLRQSVKSYSQILPPGKASGIRDSSLEQVRSDPESGTFEQVKRTPATAPFLYLPETASIPSHSRPELSKLYSSSELIEYHLGENSAFMSPPSSQHSSTPHPHVWFQKDSADLLPCVNRKPNNSKASNIAKIPSPLPIPHQQTISHSEAIPVKDGIPSGEITASNRDTERKSSEEAYTAFKRLTPLLKNINGTNFGGLLMEVLKESNAQVPLDDFYCMLYTDATPDEVRSRNRNSSKAPYSMQTLTGMKLIHLVLEAFRRPESPRNVILEGSLLSKVNFHELLRNFLALQIISRSINQTADSTQKLPRISIYKVYYILCQNLMLQFPEISDSLCLQQNLILIQAKIGVLVKLVYPDMVCKRLGKRGQSQAHYIGVTWNMSIVDDKILGLLDLDMAELMDYFKSLKEPRKENRKRRRVSKPQNVKITHAIKSSMRLPMLFSAKPLYTFVDISCKYPNLDCSPRVWDIGFDSVPQQSEWAKSVMDKSAQNLSDHGVDLGPLIYDFTNGIFSTDESNNLSGTVSRAMCILLDAPASHETLLHLYLVVILLCLPMVLSSVQEVTFSSRVFLRSCLNDCVEYLESLIYNTPSVDNISLTTFTRIMRKMVHLNELAMTSIKISSNESILEEMVRDINFSANQVNSAGETSVMEEMTIRGVIMAFNAYNFELNDTSHMTSDLGSVGTVIDIAQIIRKVLLIASDVMSNTSSFPLTKDVPYQVFNLSAKIFHEHTVRFSSFQKLPIPIITFIILHFTNGMQANSFSEFAKRGPDLSKETFKTWWVFSSMFQEYLSVISEAVALSQTLA